MITRFAPSPTGPLHLGHAYSALYASDLAEKRNGQFLLRIEDIDQSRSRKEWEDQIFDDLSWLGLSWPLPVLRQSERMNYYKDGLYLLDKMGLLYNCTCNRKDIQSAASAPQEGATPTIGPDGIVYPGTCRHKGLKVDFEQPIRLNSAKAFDILKDPIEWNDGGFQSISIEDFLKSIGDVVLSRKEMGTSYHLAVVIDDAFQNVTDVVRGKDLAEATAIHVFLQKLLGLPRPIYHHHRLIKDDAGKRLAKRDDARAISKYRDEGASPGDIRRMVGLSAV